MRDWFTKLMVTSWSGARVIAWRRSTSNPRRHQVLYTDQWGWDTRIQMDNSTKMGGSKNIKEPIKIRHTPVIIKRAIIMKIKNIIHDWPTEITVTIQQAIF